MHRFIAGTCVLTLRLTPDGPWMVRGETDRERAPGGRERNVLLPLIDRSGRPTLPASAIKGVLRSTAERILRSIGPARDPLHAPLADATFVIDQQRDLAGLLRSEVADSELVQWLADQPVESPVSLNLEPHAVYAALSAVSQLFGATLHAGLLTLTNANAATTETQRRSHVAIDRFHGGVGEGPFLEALAPANITMSTTLTITNFAFWQIALLALVVREIDEGFASFGLGTRKGQGRMRAVLSDLTFTYPELAYTVPAGIISAQARLAAPPWSVADVPVAVQVADAAPVAITLTPESSADWRSAGLRRIRVDGEHVTPLLREIVSGPWSTWIQHMTSEVA